MDLVRAFLVFDMDGWNRGLLHLIFAVYPFFGGLQSDLVLATDALPVSVRSSGGDWGSL